MRHRRTEPAERLQHPQRRAVLERGQVGEGPSRSISRWVERDRVDELLEPVFATRMLMRCGKTTETEHGIGRMATPLPGSILAA